MVTDHMPEKRSRIPVSYTAKGSWEELTYDPKNNGTDKQRYRHSSGCKKIIALHAAQYITVQRMCSHAR